MKGMKKLLSILMVLTLVLSLGAQAFAATITVDVKDELDGRQFTAYQIFKGTQDATLPDNAPLGDVEWGEHINPVEFVKALEKIEGFTAAFDAAKLDRENPDAKAVAKAIGEVAGATYNTDTAKAVAEAAFDSLNGTPGKTFTDSVDLVNGYYLIQDTTENLEGNAAYNDVVLQVTKDLTINYKTEVPTSEKKVQDRNDTDGGDNTEWQKSADWDIGDHVPFQFTGTLPYNYGDYDTYAITFHDEQSDGLTFDGETTVKAYYVNEDGIRTEISTSSYSVVTSTSDDCTFEVVFADLKTITDTKGAEIDTDATGKIVVEYTSTLNNDAVIGIVGNPNTMTMDFSNNAHGKGTGTTEESKAIVFTFDLDVNKIDQDKKPLSGAEFRLFKEVTADYKLPDGGTPTFYWVNTKTGEVVTEDKSSAVAAGEPWVLGVERELTKETLTRGDDSAENAKFYAKGLDDGKYVIVESVTPPGYNTADPTEFTITAEHTAGSDGQMTPEQLKIDPEAMKRADNKGATTDVINEQGPVLPETGGIGTTIFYIAGAVLVAGAVILLVTKKRVSGMEK